MEDIYKVTICIRDMDEFCVQSLAKIVAYVFMHKNLSFGNYKFFLIIHFIFTCRKYRVMKTH